jgi:predicted transcriptional regulator
MKRLRWAYLALALFYAAMLAGIQFHTHSVQQDHLTAHCKSCQISQTVYDEVKSGDLKISQPVLHYQEQECLAQTIHELQEIHSSRAPPLS